jgi:hypothetical protein
MDSKHPAENTEGMHLLPFCRPFSLLIPGFSCERRQAMGYGQSSNKLPKLTF